MLIYLLELVLVASYYFDFGLGLLCNYATVFAPYRQLLAVTFWVGISLLVFLIYRWKLRNVAILQRITALPYTPVVAHLGLYGLLFVGYGQFESHYAQFGKMGASFLAGSEGMSPVNRIIVLAIALTAAFAIPVIQRSAVLEQYKKRGQVIFLGLVALYASFACFGDRLFFRDGFQVRSVILFLAGAAWLFPMLLEILCIYEAAAARFQAKLRTNNPSPRRFGIEMFALLMGIWIVYLIACNPANMSSDSLGMWTQAVSGEKIGYLHYPSIQIIFVRILTSILPHPSFVALVQMALMAWLCTALLMRLYWRGVSSKFLFIIAGVWAALPPTGLMMVTLWSNIPYTTSLLFLTLVLVELSESDVIGRWTLFKLVIALPLVFSTRTTGFLPAAICVLFLIWLALRKKKSVKLLAATLTGCILIGLVQGPLYQIMTTRSELQEEQNSQPVIPMMLIDSLIGVVYLDGDLSPETTSYLESYAPLEEWKSSYSIYDVNYNDYPKKFEEEMYTSTKVLMEHFLETLAKNPFLMIQIRLQKSDLVWNVVQPTGSYNEHCMLTIISNPFSFERRSNPLTTLLTGVCYYPTLAFAPLDILLYRSGLYLILSLLLCAYLAAHRQKNRICLFLPMLGDVLALFLSLCWPCFRNIWFVSVLFFFITLTILTVPRQQESLSTAD